jgi:hypothetical protein
MDEKRILNATFSDDFDMEEDEYEEDMDHGLN